MPRRWNWDFEEERAAAAAELRSASEDGRTAAGTAQHRRRRGVAVIVLLAVVLALAVALLGGHQHGASATASTHARASARPLARARRPNDSQADERAAVAAVLAYTPFVKEAGPRGRDIALTFDDGPGPYTPGILEVLERFHVRATFFAIGEMERYFSASTARQLRDGDVVGDHTETHRALAKLSARDQHEELFEQLARIELLGGSRPTLFRPPYGSFNATTIHELHALHLLMILWSVDTDDYLLPGVPTIIQRVLAGARPGAIMLMHDGGGDRSQTIAALPGIIRGLRARGFRLVTVPQLLRDDPPPPGQPLPPSLSGD
jgi:peptidoglycan-N-acetylglucosamine deacetylase